jgi:hypothetical protein
MFWRTKLGEERFPVKGQMAGRWRLPLAGALACSLVLTACSSTPSHPSKPVVLTATKTGTNWGAGATGASPCDPLSTSGCMFPFPSDYYTVPDAHMGSGRRVYFPPAAMPVSSKGVAINPKAWERNDGFSPGSVIEVHVPGLDFSASKIPGQDHVAESLSKSAPIVLLDADNGKRLAYWAEMDIRDTHPSTQLLLIHPALNLPEGARIIVALRNMRNSAGKVIPAQGDFSRILAGKELSGSSGKALESHEKRVLAILERDAGVRKKGLFLAWDFTVESTGNLTGWAIHMRDVAMKKLGNGVPTFVVTKVVNLTPSDHGGRTIGRQIIGTFNVPSFLNGPSGDQSSTLEFGSDGLPRLSGYTEHAVFSCLIPRSVDENPALSASPVDPGRPVLYGKGLFSVATEMEIGGVRDTAYEYHLVLCSTNWMGLDGNDELYDAGLLSNLSNFDTVPDHLLQSMIDALYLGRLMASPLGFDTNPAFRAGPGYKGFIDTSDPLTYYGNSEGSLMGGAVTAISTEWTRAVLGVPSMDYAILLPRSVDFKPFYSFLDPVFPHESQQQLIFDLLQMLWDRGETDGYIEQLTNHPLPGTPAHQVLLQMAFGDHQVANVTTEIEARTIHAVVHEPVLPSGLVSGNPFWGLSPAPSSYRGPAALYVWEDPHSPPAPKGDIPPTEGIDPHDFIPRSLPAAQRQLVHFLITGTVIDVCGSAPCTTDISSEYHIAIP